MLETIIQERVKKRNNLEKAGYNPYPAKAIKRDKIKKRSASNTPMNIPMSLGKES